MADLSKHKRPLGTTGLSLSPIGLGTVKFGRNEQVKYPAGFQIPDEGDLADLMALALDLGINTLDTAPAYGESEDRLGRLLQGQRQNWIIVGKAGEWFRDGQSHFDFSPGAIEKSIKDSLKKLKTDYLDILLIHSDGNDLEILSDDKLMNLMNKLKSDGIIRAHGISTKTVDGGKMGLDRLDCVMATFHPGYREEEPVLDYAARKNKGIILKKALASGHVNKICENNPVETSLDAAFHKQSVTSAIIGTISQDHLRQNCQSAKNVLERLSQN